MPVQKASIRTVEREAIIREVIVLMTSKVLFLFPFALLLSGCSGPGQARHQQCQGLKDDAYGEQWGAALSGGVGKFRAQIDQARYEQCEQMFDLAQYQAQLQQEQATAQAKELEQERHNLLMEKLNSKEIKDKLRSAPLADLVKCEKAVQNNDDIHATDVKSMVSYICEREVERRVDKGMVSRDKINKMLNQADKNGA